MPNDDPRKASLTVTQLPFWALISFGSYLLFKLGWGVFTFNDVPEAHKEIMQQIAEARKDLSAKGVDVGQD
jgi:dolichyl-phosphate mannosyltransferase polypeptide 3